MESCYKKYRNLPINSKPCTVVERILNTLKLIGVKTIFIQKIANFTIYYKETAININLNMKFSIKK